METIKFNTNWNNKLSCHSFTTFRIHNPKKFIKGNKYRIELKAGKQTTHIADAMIIDIKIMNLTSVNNFIAHIDTGYDMIAFQKLVRTMYKNMVKDFDTQQWDFILLTKKF